MNQKAFSGEEAINRIRYPANRRSALKT